MADSNTNAPARTDGAAGGAPGAPAAAEPDPLIGRVVNGRFKIVSVIARGGMGKVYKAEQAPLGRICALKVLSPKYEGDRDPEFHKRFFLEAATAAKLTHANTVTVFDYGQDGDDLYYIAMEFIEGRTLHRTLREEGPFPEERVAHICGQICRSLREAHGIGVVHRDLKPGNILLSNRGDEHDQVKVLDFGLVKDLKGDAEDLTQAGLFMGSPKYMAPEQILGGEITARTDVYSLGVMMYEMLTGKVPFDRGASVATLMAHVNDVLQPMQVRGGARVSATMETIVRRCLEKDADKRFNGMKDVLAALKRVGNETGSFTDTQESARVGPDSFGPPSGARMPMPGSMAGAAVVPPPQTATANPSPSISETLGSVPGTLTDSDRSLPQPRNRSRAVVWAAIAITVMAGAAIFVALSGKAPAKQAERTDPTSEPTPTAAATQAATVAPTAMPTATPPALRQVRVESDPAGATVSEGDTQLCTSTPCELLWKDDAARAEHTIQVSKKGYKTSKLTVAVADEKAVAKLDAIAVVAPPPVAPPPPVPGTGRPLYKKDF